MVIEIEHVGLKSPLHLLQQMFPRGVASKMTGCFLWTGGILPPDLPSW